LARVPLMSSLSARTSSTTSPMTRLPNP
jgi:hypothetical protein